MKYDLILKNGFIFNGEELEKKDIAIKDGIIAKIDTNINELSNKTLDLLNHAIIPGYINTHIHFGEYYLKGYNKKYTTKEYIDYAETFNNNNLLNKEEIRNTSSKICAYEAIKYGQTTLMGIRGWNSIENYYARLYMGYPLMNSDKLREYLDNPFEQFQKLNSNELNTYYIFIHSLLTVNEDILKELSEYIKDNNIFLAIHLRETEKEEQLIKERYGLGSLELLEKYKLLSDKTLLVHCCYIDEKDLDRIRKYNCTISINPKSNLKLKNNILDVTHLKDINICIGTDGIATNGSLNILEDAKILGLLYDIPSNELLKMITIKPNQYLKNYTGSIKEGYKADLNIYNLDTYKFIRKETFIDDLIYSSDIIPEYVFVNGKIIIEKYKNHYLSEKEINELNISKKLKFNDR